MSVTTVGVHAYGKLPVAGDFIHFRLGGDEATALKGWMDRGQALVEAIRLSGAEPAPGGPGEARRFRFAFDPGGGRKLVVGALLESHDRGRLRWFPFAVFAEIEAAPFRDRPALLPILMQEGCEVLDRGVRSAEEAADMADVSRRLSEIALEVRTPGADARAEIDARWAATRSGDFWAALWPDGNRDRRVVLFDLILQALLPFRSSRPEEVPVAFKFPLRGEGHDTGLQCAFWIDLVSRRLPGARQAPNLFVEVSREGGSPRALHLFLQKADDKNFAALFTRSYESEYVNDLTDPPASLAGAARLGAERRAILADDSVSLADLLRLR